MNEKYHKICEIQAPAKAILCGEHAVVYGQDALAMAIELHCKAQLSLTDQKQQNREFVIKLDIENEPITIVKEAVQLFEQRFIDKEYKNNYEQYKKQLEEIFKEITQNFVTLHFKLGIFLKYFNIQWKQWVSKVSYNYCIQISSQIPFGKGLGSSAAFNTILGTSFLIIFQKINMKVITPQMKNTINELSFAFEMVQHGNPSGIDNFVSVHGGLIIYNKTKQPKFRTLSKEARILKEYFDVAIADSNVSKNTKKAVDNVRKQYQQSQEAKDRIKEIGRITSSILSLLQDEGQSKIQQLLFLIKKNHQLLRQFGLSHDQIEKLVKLGAQNGWTGKITGSGMGGCIVLLSPKEKPKQNKRIKRAQVDSEGLRVQCFTQIV